jgi:site-specific DNA recombinase
MSSSKRKTKGGDRPERFGVLVRVSTEDQEKQGESLRTQHKQIEQAVASLGGRVVEWYEGQEHATAGWERQRLDQLLADATKGKFDAVMVADVSRWSRDNVKNEQGLEVLRAAGVRFFVLQTEHDLSNPEAKLFLRLASVINAYAAEAKSKTSLENRINRARRENAPTCGSLPFGRTYDWPRSKKHPKGTGTGWHVIPTKQEAIADIADRYLRGESLKILAKEHGLKYVLVYRVLRECAGDVWVQTFQTPDGPVEVPTKVPPLLPDQTIRRVRQMCQANSTNHHGKPKHDYLLNGRIFCSGCGYLMTPQENHGTLYYRHEHHGRDRVCPFGSPRPQVRADWAESDVVFRLFGMFGSPTLLRRAINAAVPDVSREQKRKARLEADLARVSQERKRVVDAIAVGVMSHRDAKAKLDELAQREQDRAAQLAELEAALANVPTEEDVALYVEKVQDSIVVIGGEEEMTDDEGRRWRRGPRGGNDLGTWLEMTWGDKRRLVEAAFPKGQLRADGSKPGVYVVPAPDGAVMPRPGITEKDLDEHGNPPVVSIRWSLELRGLLSFDDVMHYPSY